MNTLDSVAKQVHTYTFNSLPLQLGDQLGPVTLAYETWGTLNAAGNNAVLITHALTDNTHAHDAERPHDTKVAWWNPLIGPGRFFDTSRYFVICSNILGGCYGSTGPSSLNPQTRRPYGMHSRSSPFATWCGRWLAQQVSADPRIVANTRLIPRLTYAEAARLSWFGAKVLHPRALIPVAHRNIPVRVRNTFRPYSRGTVVGPALATRSAAAAITVRRQLALITVENGDLFGAPANTGQMFSLPARAGAAPVVICSSSGHQLEESAADSVAALLQHDMGIWRVFFRRGLAACACIGSTFTADQMNPARWLRALAHERIPVIAQGASETDIILTASLTATPTNIREKQRSTMNDEPFRPASGGRRRTQANGIHRVPPSAYRVKNLNPLYASSRQRRGWRYFSRHGFLPVDSNLTATGLSRSCSREI